MLLLLLSLASTPPVAVDVTGMEPQLQLVRKDAVERGWQIDCEGRAGEEGVVRLAFPPGTNDEAIAAISDPDHHFGSSYRYHFAGDVLPKRCDQEPATVSSSAPHSVLAMGSRDVMTGLVDIARACGFTGTTLRERREGDAPFEETPPEDWLALDAGEDVGGRYGPSICFLQTGMRPLLIQQQ